MNPIQAIILGIVQGLTEFIPVSSSGHLELIPRLFGWPQASTIFIVFSHMGTLLALLIYFFPQIREYLKVIWYWIRGFRVSKKEAAERQVIVNVLLATIPAGLFGLLGEKFITDFYENPAYADYALLATLIPMAILGLIFILFHRLVPGKKMPIQELSPKRAGIIGLSQALALLRGTSRSGITVLTGQLVGLSRVSAAEFSFLMSIPITTALAVYGVYKLIKLPIDQLQAELLPGVIGAVTSFVFGYIAVRFMLRYLKRNNLAIFGWYRLIFVAICVALLLL